MTVTKSTETTGGVGSSGNRKRGPTLDTEVDLPRKRRAVESSTSRSVRTASAPAHTEMDRLLIDMAASIRGYFPFAEFAAAHGCAVQDIQDILDQVFFKAFSNPALHGQVQSRDPGKLGGTDDKKEIIIISDDEDDVGSVKNKPTPSSHQSTSGSHKFEQLVTPTGLKKHTCEIPSSISSPSPEFSSSTLKSRTPPVGNDSSSLTQISTTGTGDISFNLEDYLPRAYRRPVRSVIRLRRPHVFARPPPSIFNRIPRVTKKVSTKRRAMRRDRYGSLVPVDKWIEGYHIPPLTEEPISAADAMSDEDFLRLMKEGGFKQIPKDSNLNIAKQSLW
ncbi:hypothetical protein N7462_003447 [Penicillium macrosclerotiorum]|uniref:uncharacterized protein n=1 Tax=Penicillium macrosclerotiorum TaxID=303699 RepID=UPI0025468C81|nr:uncharacterized protein N7462_003447 [Penicillium macrosclerotiorum]KAJ5689055.1 hypothetical protein N7462_003447 [Penicillium macrosclerotiorum]